MVGVTGVSCTVNVIPVLVTVCGLAQVAFDVILQVTVCPFVNVAVENVLVLAPTLVPFIFH